MYVYDCCNHGEPFPSRKIQRYVRNFPLDYNLVYPGFMSESEFVYQCCYVRNDKFVLDF